MSLFGSKSGGAHAVKPQPLVKKSAETEANAKEPVKVQGKVMQVAGMDTQTVGNKPVATKPQKVQEPKSQPEQPQPKRTQTEAVAQPETRREQSVTTAEIINERNNKKKKKKAGKVILIIVLIFALVAAIGVAAIYFMREAPEQNDEGIKGDAPVVPDGRKKGVYTFLVAGTDMVSSNTDTIMVGSFDTENHKLNIVSIPRDTLINLSHEVKKANSAYHYATYYSTDSSSSYYGVDPIESMRTELVERLLGFDVDNYVLVNIDACAEVVDCIGGVDFNVPIDMKYNDPTQDLVIDLNAGEQTLNGENFVKVMRFRYSYAGGDIERIQTQHDLLMALAKQMLSLGNVPNVGKVASIISENMQTNLSTENIMYYITEFLKLDDGDINFYTLPGDTSGSIFGYSYVYTDIDAWLQMVNDYINPYTVDVTVNNVDIVTYKDGNFYYTNDETKLLNGVESFLGYSSDSAMGGAGVVKYKPQG